MSTAPLADEAARERLRRASASLDLAELTGSPFAMSQALAEVARCHRELHAEVSAEAHFETATRWARLVGSSDHLADLLCELADAAARVALAQDLQAMLAASGEMRHPAGPADTLGRCAAGHAARERARDHAFEASQVVGHLSDAACEARLLLRVSEVLERCGDHADALQMQQRALNLMGGVAPRDAAQLSGFGRLADC
jgi:hypothetical protein